MSRNRLKPLLLQFFAMLCAEHIQNISLGTALGTFVGELRETPRWPELMAALVQMAHRSPGGMGDHGTQAQKMPVQSFVRSSERALRSGLGPTRTSCQLLTYITPQRAKRFTL